MKTAPDHGEQRRALLLRTVAALALTGCAPTHPAEGVRAGSGSKADQPEVTPGEDLMQEHGVIQRILLIYDEAARRIESGAKVDGAVLTGAATIVRRFIQDYHEKTEERFVFPRLQAAQREADLVAILLRQHQRGRDVTEDILRRAPAGGGMELSQALRGFTRMYRPHAAREDTVVFPAFRELLGKSEYAELGEQFEDKEHELFGEHGFEHTVSEVARLELALGIDELEKFTA